MTFIDTALTRSFFLLRIVMQEDCSAGRVLLPAYTYIVGARLV